MIPLKHNLINPMNGKNLLEPDIESLAARCPHIMKCWPVIRDLTIYQACIEPNVDPDPELFPHLKRLYENITGDYAVCEHEQVIGFAEEADAAVFKQWMGG